MLGHHKPPEQFQWNNKHASNPPGFPLIGHMSVYTDSRNIIKNSETRRHELGGLWEELLNTKEIEKEPCNANENLGRTLGLKRLEKSLLKLGGKKTLSILWNLGNSITVKDELKRDFHQV